MLEIANLTKQKIDENLLKNAATKALAILGTRGLEEISLVLAGETKIKALNRKYLKRNRVTDVLSFEGLNEIFICVPEAARHSKLLKTSLNSELTRLLVHGIVHLKGYGHEGLKQGAKRMEKIENKILNNV